MALNFNMGNALNNDPQAAIMRYMQPYNQAGLNALPILQGQYGSLLNDPAGMLNKIGQGYQQSPGFKFALNQALGASDRASAAGGMAGSPMHSQQNMQVATGLANQDYNNWISRALGLYGQGLSGEQNIYGIGAKTGSQMGEDIAHAIQNQQMMEQMRKMQESQNQYGLLGGVLGLGGGIAAHSMGWL